jgi:hypothetical protein
MLEKSERACLFCNSTDMEVIFSYDKPDKYEVAVGVVQERYFRSWVKCTNCNFHYSIYSRDSKILDSIYLTEYRSGESDWRNSSVEDVFYYVKDLPKKESETSYRVEWIKNHIDQAWNGNWVKKTNTKLHRLLDVGGATDNICIERFWRSAKVERIYLNAYQNIGELITDVDDYIEFYNYRRFHQTLDYKKPMDAYQESIKLNQNKKKAS